MCFRVYARLCLTNGRNIVKINKNRYERPSPRGEKARLPAVCTANGAPLFFAFAGAAALFLDSGGAKCYTGKRNTGGADEDAVHTMGQGE